MTVQTSERRVEVEPRYPADAVLASPAVVDTPPMRRTEDPAGSLAALGDGTKSARTLVPRTIQPGSIRLELPIEAARWLALRLARGAW